MTPYQYQQQSAYTSYAVPDRRQDSTSECEGPGGKSSAPSKFRQQHRGCRIGQENRGRRGNRHAMRADLRAIQASPERSEPVRGSARELSRHSDGHHRSRASGPLGQSGDLRDDDKRAGTGPGSSIRLETTSPNVNQGAPGTLGAVVNNGQESYILSCNHVLSVNGRVLSDPDASVVTPALSAAPQSIAVPTEHFVELKRRKENLVDCAIALVNGGSSVAKPPVVNANFRVFADAGAARAPRQPPARPLVNLTAVKR